MSVHLLLDLTLMLTQRWENHTLVAEFRWRRLTLRCLTHVTQAAWQAVIDMWQGASYRIAHNRVHTSTGTSGSSSQSMGINGRMRQKTRRRWRHPQLFPYSYGVCTEEREDQRESKEEGQRQHQSKSCIDRQWSVGRKRKGQRLSKVQPRALCVSDCHRTDFALSRMGPHWDTVYIDQGVSRRGRQVQRQIYQPYRRWRFGDWFWWPVRRSTHRLGHEYFARTRQWIPKSNAQQQLDSSDASPDVKPIVGARKIRSVAAHSPTISTPSLPATARSVIQPGVVADVPSPWRERQVHWGPAELGYANGLDRCVIARSDARTGVCNHESSQCVEAKPIFEIRGEALSVLRQSVVKHPFELHREDKDSRTRRDDSRAWYLAASMSLLCVPGSSWKVA